ncbi:MAG: hypothetical protein SFV55_21155 [Haliscomenobacter sp.]|uniref:hypothetical protein n=1 Tax=Haliscomenobacter sp. TaxID=2717303 RepID=UPI0029A04351|nr:hypothetical protein [Haliscomenobacter sp.]MDX2070951.1 hypothetical protein [Haliscomenobacter sp.]
MMKKSGYFLFCLLILLLASTCSNPPEFPAEPVIEYLGLSHTSIDQSRGGGIPLDTIEIRFAFTDGDGDLGSEDSTNISLTDSRDNFEHFFKVSPIPQLGSGDGIQGEISIKLTNSPDTKYFCCTFPNTRLTCIPSTTFPTDSLSYFIRIRDRSGNWSNTIKTERITIFCK